MYRVTCTIHVCMHVICRQPVERDMKRNEIPLWKRHFIKFIKFIKSVYIFLYILVLRA